jgi:lipoate-protein ligase A
VLRFVGAQGGVVTDALLANADAISLVRGRGNPLESDRAVTGAMLDQAADGGVPTVRAWTPHRQLAFGRRDANADGYDRARAAAESRGFPPRERRVGGRAVAYTGDTVAFAVAVPTNDSRAGVGERYDAAVSAVVDALRSLDVPARPGEPSNSFCPGAHSVQGRGKIAGVAQRVRRDAALVSGIVVVRDHDEIAAVLDPVYDALGVPFDPDSVGSVAQSGRSVGSTAVVDALFDAFCGESRRQSVTAAALLDSETGDRVDGESPSERNRRS